MSKVRVGLWVTGCCQVRRTREEKETINDVAGGRSGRKQVKASNEARVSREGEGFESYAGSECSQVWSLGGCG